MSSIEQRYRIVHTDSSSISTDITEAISIGEDEGIETTIDTFEFSILIPTIGRGTLPVFAVNHLIKIYFNEGSATPTTLVMDGVITEVTWDINADNFIVTVRGMNRIERLLNTPKESFYNTTFSYGDNRYGGDGIIRNGIPGIITNLIDLANQQKPEGESNITYDTTSILTTKSDGVTWGNLPRAYYSNWKSIFETIEELSRDEWTEDGSYVFWLDTANKFHWVAMRSSTYNTVTDDLDIEQDQSIVTKIQHTVFDIINAIIMDCGDDLNGNTILTFGFDGTSMGQNGPKWKYINKKDLAERYVAQNPAANNDTVRADVKALGKALISKILTLYGNPRYKVDVQRLGTTSFVKGRIYRLRSSSLNWTGDNRRKLRLRQLSHSFTSNGWITSLHFEEDEETIFV